MPSGFRLTLFLDHVIVGAGAASGLHIMMMSPFKAPTIWDWTGFFCREGGNSEMGKFQSKA